MINCYLPLTKGDTMQLLSKYNVKIHIMLDRLENSFYDMSRKVL